MHYNFYCLIFGEFSIFNTEVYVDKRSPPQKKKGFRLPKFFLFGDFLFPQKMILSLVVYDFINIICTIFMSVGFTLVLHISFHTFYM